MNEDFRVVSFLEVFAFLIDPIFHISHNFLSNLKEKRRRNDFVKTSAEI